MRRKIVFLFLVMVIGLLVTTTVLAGNIELKFEGESKVETGKTGKVTLKLTADEDCGNISGKIKGENGLTIKSITGKNSWSVMAYNEETGEFKLLKPAGAKVEETMEIEYQAGDQKQTGKISIENAKVTTVGYELKDLGTISKEITIGETTEPPAEEKKISGIKIVTAPTKTEYTEGEKFDPTGMKVELVYTDGSTKETTDYKISKGEKLEVNQTSVVIYYTYENKELEAVQTITVKAKAAPSGTEQEQEQKKDPAKETQKEDNTVAKVKNPDTGIEKMMLPIGILMVLSGVGLILYTKNKNI